MRRMLGGGERRARAGRGRGKGGVFIVADLRPDIG